MYEKRVGERLIGHDAVRSISGRLYPPAGFLMRIWWKARREPARGH